VISYLSNSANAKTRLQFPGGNCIDYDRDTAGSLKSFGWNTSLGLYSQTYTASVNWTRRQGRWRRVLGYDAVGRLTSFTNNFTGTANNSTCSFGFTGQMFIADARLHYYQARVDDTQFGRFL